MLGFAHEYYYAPAALLAWLYAGKVAELAIDSAGAERKTAAAIGFVVLAVIALLDAPTAFSDIYAPWKENVASKADAARFIAGFDTLRRGKSTDEPLRIVFPANTNYEIAYFIGYLEAKYAIEKIEVGMAADASGEKTELCVRWMVFECHYGLSVRPGDLVVYFGEQGGRLDVLKKRYRLIHVSPDIGFWANDFRVYVFQAP